MTLFIDRVDLQPLDFSNRLKTDHRRPTSSHVGVSDFQQAYEQAIQSGAYQMAVNAGTLVDVLVTVIDSKGPTMTLDWQVLAAARARHNDLPLKEIAACVTQV